MSVNMPSPPAVTGRTLDQAEMRSQRNRQWDRQHSQAAFEAALRRSDPPRPDTNPMSLSTNAQFSGTEPQRQAAGALLSDASLSDSSVPTVDAGPSPSPTPAPTPTTFAAQQAQPETAEAVACTGHAGGVAPQLQPASVVAAETRGHLPTEHAIDPSRLQGAAIDTQAIGRWQFDLSGQQLPVQGLWVQRAPGGQLDVALRPFSLADEPPSASSLQRLRERLALHGNTLAPWREGDNP